MCFWRNVNLAMEYNQCSEVFFRDFRSFLTSQWSEGLRERDWTAEGRRNTPDLPRWDQFCRRRLEACG